MAVAGVYKRVLPCPPAIEFASPEGKELFAEAFADGMMNGFFRLIGTFQTQAEPAFCGLTSLSVVLNALSIDPGRKWKGPWRWFDESMLDCCEPLEKVKQEGITFAKVACLAKCAGASIQAFRADESSLNSFRAYVEECASSESRHLICSYDRRPLEQTGIGHFSPLGGFHRQRDMALILDVARFKYPPHWIPLSLLWKAINTIDESSGKARGFMVVYKYENPPSLLFTLSCKDEHWRAMSKYLIEEVPQLLRMREVTNVQQVLDAVFGSLPVDVATFVKWIIEVKLVDEAGKHLDRYETDRLEDKRKVLQHLRATKIYDLVKMWMGHKKRSCSVCPAKESLQEVVAQACCQGAAALLGVNYLSNITCVKHSVETNAGSCEHGSASVVSNNIFLNGCERTVDALVPTASDMVCESCICTVKADSLHPSTEDLLAILILSLPVSTWREIPDSDLQSEMLCLVSTVDLPNDLRQEVAHLSEQAILVNESCKLTDG